MHWTDDLHRLLIAIADVVNRIDVDLRLLAASDIKLDRALFPLLSRLSLNEPLNTVELANIVGRGHSTVSRQISKLEASGLVERVPHPTDLRARELVVSAAGHELLDRIATVRRIWLEEHFNHWSQADLQQLIALMSRMFYEDKVGARNLLTPSKSGNADQDS